MAIGTSDGQAYENHLDLAVSEAGESPEPIIGGAQPVPKEGKQILAQPKPEDQLAQVGQWVSKALYGMVPDSLKPATDEEWNTYHKQMSQVPEDYTGKVVTNPDEKRNPVQGALDAGLTIAGGPELAGGKALFFGIAGVKRILGEETVNRVVKAAENMELEGFMRHGDYTGFNELLIKNKTGLERGADNKWRIEFSDADIHIDNSAFAPLVSSSPGEANMQTASLVNVFKHPRLFEAYPELKGFSVVRIDKIPGSDTAIGQFHEAGKTIYIKNGLDSELERNVIIHEIQHAIQHAEGFSRGGSVLMFMPRSYQQAMQELPEAEKQITQKLEKLAVEMNIPKEEMHAMMVNPWMYPKYADVYEKLKGTDLHEDIQRIHEVYKALSAKREEASFKYRTLSGEVESRNAEYRSRMTRDEQRASLGRHSEDIPRSGQILNLVKP